MLRPPCDEGIITAGSVAVRDPSCHKWVLAATILGSSMAFIDGTVVNVALPALQTNLNATVADVQWVVESYALFLAALLLVGGSLGDRFGRRLIYSVGVILFAIASIWCGLSPSISQLIVARAVQGIGAALLVPGSLAIISASFNQDERGAAIGTWAGFTSVTAAIGPVIGGWLIEHFSWRWAFLINVPLAAVVLVLLFWRVPESRDEEDRSRLDLLGALIATTALGSLVYGLIESSNLGFHHPAVFVSILTGAGLSILFLFVEARSSHPMLPLSLFRSRDFTGANLLTLFLYAALGGALFFFPLNLIQVQGYSATAAGAAFLPFIAIMFSLSHWSGTLVKRYGARLPLTIGPVIAAIGFGLFVVPSVTRNYWTSFFPAVILLGFGMAVSVAPLTTTVMNAVEVKRSGIASGVSNAVSRTASLLAVAVFGVVMLHGFNQQLDQRLEKINVPQSATDSLKGERIKLAAIKIPADLDQESSAKIRKAIQISFISGFRSVMIVAACLAVASGLIAYMTIQGKS
jgi:EmrB/QacA subfamily drug resistance transporter